MSMSTRRAQYKAPPLTKQGSQEARRQKALDDQKRRRAQRIDSARNLDLFASLTLGPSDDEDEEDETPLRTGISAYASLLKPDQTGTSRSSPSLDGMEAGEDAEPDYMTTTGGSNFIKKKPRRKRRAGKTSAPKASKYANKCMYAELLEMRMDVPWTNNGYGISTAANIDDGLPQDLETGWVAVAPVPAGKRCLVVTYQSSGVAGNVPNTQLRSRLLGKSLVRPFPSPLPAQTILDCILDENWRDNGLIHVLDVVKWKAQDVGDCETAFRFWFRDARLSELPTPTPPLTLRPTSSSQPEAGPSRYRFPYPCTFLPVPYASDTSLPSMLSQVIPAARSVRTIDLVIPQLASSSSPFGLPSVPFAPSITTEVTMQVETGFVLPTPLPTPAPLPAQTFIPAQGRAEVKPDGLLLYVREASYEPGTSPLSNWVPVELELPIDEASMGSENMTSNAGGSTRPLDLFEWLIRRRLGASGGQITASHYDMMDS